MAADQAAILGLIRELSEDRWAAHRHIFARRHPEESCEAHQQIVGDIHSDYARVSIEGFRGIGKSTHVEEAVVLKAGLREFKNLVIASSSYTRACDRIAAIKREIEINEVVQDLFGITRQSCPIWQEGKIVLASGACIQGLGRDQSTAGIKHLEWRPDALIIDDAEDPQEVRTDAEREETWIWMIETLLPALDDITLSWVRMLATRRGSGSLPERVEKDGGWLIKKYPIEHPGPAGERIATWPAKFPIAKIDQIKRLYRGNMMTYMQEFMCQATSEADRIFTRSMIRVVPRVKTWEAVYGMIDPARTVRAQSATTGWAVWSWVRNRLIVWGAGADRLLPDEIVALAFDINERFGPIELGFEEDGLNQWALQPLRQEATKRGVFLPLRPMKAPRGKTQFIGGLQPFFINGEVELAQAMPALVDQLLSFPTGDIDAPNALAYALMMRPGLPVYESFAQEHIAEAPDYDRSRPLSLVANATGSLLTAILAQHTQDRLVVLADWMLEGRPTDLVSRVWADAAQLAASTTRIARVRPWDEMLKTAMPDEYLMRRLPPVWMMPARHADTWMNVGLLQAAKMLPAETRLGGSDMTGRTKLSEMLSARHHGMPMVAIAPEATWTLRALAGGYARGMAKGRLKDEPEPGPYRTLMEGLESFLGAMRSEVSEDDALNYRVDPRSGRRYVSAMPERVR